MIQAIVWINIEVKMCKLKNYFKVIVIILNAQIFNLTTYEVYYVRCKIVSLIFFSHYLKRVV